MALGISWNVEAGPEGSNSGAMFHEHKSVVFSGRVCHRSSKSEIVRCEDAGLDYFGVMDWQQLVSLAVVGVTALAFLWSRVRRRGRFDLMRDTHCGCSSPSGTQARIILRVRKGERPEVIVKPH